MIRKGHVFSHLSRFAQWRVVQALPAGWIGFGLVGIIIALFVLLASYDSRDSKHANIAIPVKPAGTSVARPEQPKASSLAGARDSVITASNAANVKLLHRLGKGKANQTRYSPDGHFIVQATTIGIYIYDAETYEEVHFIEEDGTLKQLLFFERGSDSYLLTVTTDSLEYWNLTDFMLTATYPIDVYPA